MPFDPEHLDPNQSISAGDDAVETTMENEFSENAEGRDEGIAAQAHTIKVGPVG